MNEIPLELVDCGVCGGTKSRYLFHAKDYIYFQTGEWPVAQCVKCGVVFMNPRIPPDEIEKFYPQDYYTNNSASIKRRWPWARSIKDKAIQKYYGYSIPIVHSLFGRFIGWILIPFTKRWTETTKYITPIPGGKVLDVGCGNGERLSEYKRLGWETTGVEVGIESAKLAQSAGHKVFIGELTDFVFPSGEFDAVTMWDSLEHIHNPSQIMQEVYRVIKPGGKVYIAVPNFGSWYGRYFKDRWFMFTAPLHYYHYTRETLTFLVKQAGFEHIQIFYPLGDAGLAPTINTFFKDNKTISSILHFFPVRALLKLLDFVMPKGHLLATAKKTV